MTRLAVRIAAAALGCTLMAAGAGAQSALPKPKPQQSAAAPPAGAAGPEDDADAAFSSFQRGFYLTAFHQATRRLEQKADPKAMTLLGELYAHGYGVPSDDQKAAEWYRLAADRGDREAMFAIAMFRMSGRGGPSNREEAARLLVYRAAWQRQEGLFRQSEVPCRPMTAVRSR